MVFSRRVDEYLAKGLPLARAIERAADYEAHAEDPYEVMRREAMERESKGLTQPTD